MLKERNYKLSTPWSKQLIGVAHNCAQGADELSFGHSSHESQDAV